jgi:hypothetical protein
LKREGAESKIEDAITRKSDNRKSIIAIGLLLLNTKIEDLMNAKSEDLNKSQCQWVAIVEYKD